MFKKILIANRGEIAVRVIRACREMGISTVAVYSEADPGALHVRMADEAYEIGPAPSRESYLVTQKMIDVAKRAKADAVHPGYGFLAENAVFAGACRDAGVTFIGPSPESIALMGSKVESRRAAALHGVEMVPGTLDPISSDEEARKIASSVGYPIMLKASAGGGGSSGFPSLLCNRLRSSVGPVRQDKSGPLRQIPWTQTESGDCDCRVLPRT